MVTGWNKIAGGYNGMNGLLELVIGDFDGSNKIKLPGNQSIEDINGRLIVIRSLLLLNQRIF